MIYVYVYMQTRLFIKTTLECGYKMTSIPNVFFFQIQMPCIYCCVRGLLANSGAPGQQGLGRNHHSD